MGRRLMTVSVCCYPMLPYWFRPELGISYGLFCVPALVLEPLLLPQLFAETLSQCESGQLWLSTEPAWALLLWRTKPNLASFP